MTSTGLTSPVTRSLRVSVIHPVFVGAAECRFHHPYSSFPAFLDAWAETGRVDEAVAVVVGLSNLAGRAGCAGKKRAAPDPPQPPMDIFIRSSSLCSGMCGDARPPLIRPSLVPTDDQEKRFIQVEPQSLHAPPQRGAVNAENLGGLSLVSARRLQSVLDLGRGVSSGVSRRN